MGQGAGQWGSEDKFKSSLKEGAWGHGSQNDRFGTNIEIKRELPSSELYERDFILHCIYVKIFKILNISHASCQKLDKAFINLQWGISEVKLWSIFGLHRKLHL